jgi:hypothetical protein
MDRESSKGHAMERETMGCGNATESMVDTVQSSGDRMRIEQIEPEGSVQSRRREGSRRDGCEEWMRMQAICRVARPQDGR